MSKVIRLNNQNVKLLEEIRKAYIKNSTQSMYIYEYASDNQMIRTIFLDILDSFTIKKEE